MRKIYVITGTYELKHREITKVICVCSSNKKAAKNAEIAKKFYQIVKIYTEVLI